MAPFCCRIGLFLLAITSLSACPDKPTPVKNRVVDQRPKPLALSREQALLRIQRKEWRRTRADRWLYDQLRSDDPLLRARAVIALGYLGDLRELSPLWALLRDPNTRIRRAAAFALQTHEQRRVFPNENQQRALQKALQTALVDERDRQTMQIFLRSLGRIGSVDARQTLIKKLHSPDRKAALLAWGDLVARVETPLSAINEISGLLAPKKAPVALASWAMSRLVTRRQRKNLDPLAIDGCWPQRDNAVDETTLSKALVARLKTIVESSSDSNARVWALESLAAAKMSSALEDWLLGRLFDPDYRVRVAAAQRLASASLWGAMRLGVAARKMWKEVAANHFRLTGKRVHAVLASLEALEAHARVPMIRQVATDLLEASDGSGATVNYSPEEALSIDRVHCAAARLYDLGYGRIERSAICGTARAPQLDKSWRRRHVISVIADMERPAGWKLMMLRRYFIDRDPTVRAAALRALLEVDSKNISAPLLDGLGEKQLDVFDTAVRVSFARKTLLAGASAARLRPVVRRLHQLNPLLKPRASCTVIVGLAASQNAAVVPILRTISDGAAIATRRCARQALVSLGATPQGLFARASTSRGLPDDTWAGGQHKQPPRRAIWVSRRGEVEIELYADLAPAAVARFARLSYTQAFRGATIDRVLPGKYLSAAPVIISRDARLTLPDELTPTPVTRGSLIFVPRCGADTAGHRILVALSRLPELDGRVTVFGRVRTGLSLLHRTLAPEQIKDLYIPRLPQKRALPRRPRNKPSKPEGSPPKKNGKSGAK